MQKPGFHLQSLQLPPVSLCPYFERISSPCLFVLFFFFFALKHCSLQKMLFRTKCTDSAWTDKGPTPLHEWLAACPWDKSACVCVCVWCLCPQSCLTFCNPMDCSPPVSSVHGIFQARILEWGLPFLLPQDLPNPGIKPVSLPSPALQADSLPQSHSGRGGFRANKRA